MDTEQLCRCCRTGFPAARWTSQAIPKPTALALQEKGAGHLAPSPLTQPPSPALKGHIRHNHQDPVSRPRGGAKLGESHSQTLTLPTPSQVGLGQAITGPFSEPPWSSHRIWDLGHGVVAALRGSSALKLPGVEDHYCLVLFRAEPVPPFLHLSEGSPTPSGAGIRVWMVNSAANSWSCLRE